MHVHCLHWLMSTGLFFQSNFCRPCKSTTGEWHQRRDPIWLWELILLPLSVHVCLGLVVEYWPYVGTCTNHKCTNHNYSTFYYLYHLASLLKLLPPPTPPLHPSCPLPYICWPNINEFHKKSSKTGKNQPLSTCQVSCRKVNI